MGGCGCACVRVLVWVSGCGCECVQWNSRVRFPSSPAYGNRNILYPHAHTRAHTHIHACTHTHTHAHTLTQYKRTHKRTLTKTNKQTNAHVRQVLVRKVPDEFQFSEICVCVCGNVDVGKSTLLGTLVTGHLDNGRGCSRLYVFRHKHEVQSGRTSSICREILGYVSIPDSLSLSPPLSLPSLCVCVCLLCA